MRINLKVVLKSYLFSLEAFAVCFKENSIKGRSEMSILRGTPVCHLHTAHMSNMSHHPQFGTYLKKNK